MTEGNYSAFDEGVSFQKPETVQDCLDVLQEYVLDILFLDLVDLEVAVDLSLDFFQGCAAIVRRRVLLERLTSCINQAVALRHRQVFESLNRKIVMPCA